MGATTGRARRFFGDSPVLPARPPAYLRTVAGALDVADHALMKRAIAAFVLWAYMFLVLGSMLEFAFGIPSAPVAGFGVVVGLLIARGLTGHSARPTKAMLDRLPHPDVFVASQDGTGLFV